MIKINGFGHIFAEGGIQRQQEQKVPPVHHSLKRRLSEGSRRFHNHREGPYLPWGQCPFSIVDSVLNVKVYVGAFNQEKALVGAFSVIVKSSRTFG